MKKQEIGLTAFLRNFRDIRLPWVMLIVSVALSVGNYFVTLWIAELTSDVVDKSGNIASADLFSYIVSAAAMVLCTGGTFLLSGIAAEKINLSLRKKLWKKMMHLRRSSYESDQGESLVSRITVDCDYASTLFTTVIEMLSGAVGIAIYYYELFSQNAKISVLTLLLLPASVLIAFLYGRLRYRISERNQQKLAEASGYLIERIYNLKLVRASNMQEREREAAYAKFGEQYRIELQRGLLDSLDSFINAAFPVVSMIIVFLLGGRLVNQGLMTAGAVYAFYLVANNASTAFSNLIHDFGSIKESFGALARVTGTLEEAEEALDEGIKLQHELQDLRFSRISFGYSEKDVFKGLEMEIPKGRITALCGGNGAGKSTLFRLLLRLYEPRAGEIRTENACISDLSLRSLRREIAYIPQDHIVLGGTLRDNLNLGGQGYTDDDFDRVFAKLGLTDFIDGLPERYDTVLLPDGSNLSGGQKQMVGLARAVLRGAKLLLLDEATCSLDKKTENAVSGALLRGMREHTVVLIAHDLRMIRLADRAVMIQDGKIRYTGKPEGIENILSVSDNKTGQKLSGEMETV